MITITILLQTQPNIMSTVWAIVFWTVLALCVALFFFFLKRTNRFIEAEKETKQVIEASSPSHLTNEEPNDEEAAAIALAIHLYKSELHDRESFTITLQKVSRIYSPWSSKIYTLREYPRK